MSTMFFRDPVGFSLKHPPTAKSKCPSFIAKVSLVGVERERDQVFIGNQREQLQKEPAQVPSCHNRSGWGGFSLGVLIASCTASSNVH